MIYPRRVIESLEADVEVVQVRFALVGLLKEEIEHRKRKRTAYSMLSRWVPTNTQELRVVGDVADSRAVTLAEPDMNAVEARCMDDDEFGPLGCVGGWTTCAIMSKMEGIAYVR